MTAQTEEILPNPDTIQVRLKDDAVIKYLSEGIYKSWKSAIRELFANELTAALTAQEIDPHANPRIEIRINPETRELVIHGMDSLGITQDTFADKLIYYGRSGNTSFRKLGRFGFGIKSYVAIGKSIKIESYSRETNQRFGVVGSEGAYFKRMPDKELSISDHGTKISIILKDDEKEEEETSYNGKTTVTKRRIIEFEELIKTIREVCLYSDIDTFLTINSDIKERKHSYYGWSSYESIVAKAGREKISYSPREYAESQLDISGKDSVKFEFELDEPDFSFFGILASSNGNREVNVSPSNGEVRLIKMPIEVTVPEERQDRAGETRDVEPEYPMSFWFVNLKDESIFPPTPDRER